MIENKNFLNGRIEVICGSMFSGKTEELIRRIKKVELSNTSFILFKPKKDSRNSKEKIVSHAKNEIKCKLIDESKEILKNSKGYSVIGIDEAQFFDENLVLVLNL